MAGKHLTLQDKMKVAEYLKEIANEDGIVETDKSAEFCKKITDDLKLERPISWSVVGSVGKAVNIQIKAKSQTPVSQLYAKIDALEVRIGRLELAMKNMK